MAIVRALASLKLSVVLLALAMVLIYVGTWAQIDAGIYQVQQQFFHSWIAKVPLGVILPRTSGGEMAIPGSIILPGGYTVGLLMLLNLLANWFTRYELSWRKSGVHLVHLGIVMLLLGEAWTSATQVDARLVLTNGETKDYTEDSRQCELAVIDRSPADHDAVVAFRYDTIRTGATLRNPEIPVSLRVDEVAQNSALLGPMQRAASQEPKATAGDGVGITMVPLNEAAGVSNGVNSPAVYVTVLQNGADLGKYLLSMDMPLARPQQVKLTDGRELWLQLRAKRYTKPYSITLLEFRHDRYVGTDIPRNYSSRVRLVDRELGIDREELIKMNHPLRHRGETFYQASFSGEDTTVLQVVRNPAVWVPYWACAIGTIGLLMQAAFGLQRGIARRREVAPLLPVGRTAGGSYALPVTLAAFCVAALVAAGFYVRVAADDLAQAPVYFDGRLQPMDSVARNALRAMNGKSSVTTGTGETVGPVQWIFDLLCRPEVAMKYPTFRIDNPEVIATLKLDPARNRFSPAEIQPGLEQLGAQVQKASETAAAQRDLTQRKLLELWGKMQLFSRLTNWAELYLMPPDDTHAEWHRLGPILEQARAAAQMPSALPLTIATALTDVRDGGLTKASDESAKWIAQIEAKRPSDMAKMRLEVMYNRFEPFLWAMGLYVLVFLLACGSLLFSQQTMWRSAMAVALVALVLHTVAIALRVYIQGRPPVTNLYSSAIFIGWGAVLLAMGIERMYRNGIAVGMASLVATATLVVAQNLAQGGDTMPSMQAVLDSNFWLTTHVLAITYGYSAAFVAGAMGIAFVVAGLAARNWFTSERRAALGRMIYGTTVFALIFSFTGTLLGGIWADQSWGRFWGWDPKENGAALIVLWLSIMLHVRFIGVRYRGLAVLAIFANVVTAWSWFGTNMLGVGLHSYGFMDSALRWLLFFVFTQLVLIGLGLFVKADEDPAPVAAAEASGPATFAK